MLVPLPFLVRIATRMISRVLPALRLLSSNNTFLLMFVLRNAVFFLHVISFILFVTTKASLPVRLKYLVNEHRPHLSVHDDGRGAVGMRVAYRYATILHRTRSNNKGGSNGGAGGGGAAIDHPVEAFVQKKLAEDFTETGTANVGFRSRKAPEDAWRTGHDHNLFEVGGFIEHGWGDGADGSSGDPYTRLLIPGSIYHMRKLGAESVAASAAGSLAETPSDARRKLYWMEREKPEEVNACSVIVSVL